MIKVLKLIGIMMFLIISKTTYAYELAPLPISKTKTPIDPKCLECLNKLLNSYEGEYDVGTSEVISYRMFAIKYKKEWFMLAIDNVNNLSSYRAIPNADSVQILSEDLTADLCKFLEKQFYVKTERKYNECLAVGDIPIKRYYALNKEGKKAFKGIYTLEFGKQPSPVLKAIVAPFKAIMKVIKKPKVPDPNKAIKEIPVTISK
ncbi:MAG: hypothetical protein OHK0057_27520 [Thermoflexibacter sp.]